MKYWQILRPSFPCLNIWSTGCIVNLRKRLQHRKAWVAGRFSLFPPPSQILEAVIPQGRLILFPEILASNKSALCRIAFSFLIPPSSDSLHYRSGKIEPVGFIYALLYSFSRLILNLQTSQKDDKQFHAAVMGFIMIELVMNFTTFGGS